MENNFNESLINELTKAFTFFGEIYPEYEYISLENLSSELWFVGHRYEPYEPYKSTEIMTLKKFLTFNENV